MKYGNLIIEKKEYLILKRLMNLSGYNGEDIMRKSVQKLVCELESARICDENDMPKDVIRFYSTVTVISDNGWRKTFKVVMPADSNVKVDKISILTPMGTALIGYAEGDSITWEFPAKEQVLTVEKVVQESKYINANMVL